MMYLFFPCTVGSEWEGGSNITDWIYGKKYCKVYERALDTTLECSKQC